MNMMQTPLADYSEAIDKRILKQEYRNYDLVARYWEYAYLGKIWKNRKAIEEIEAVDDEGIDALIVKMKVRVDKLIAEKSRSRENRAPDGQELATALQQVRPRLSDSERLILQLHRDCPDGIIEMEKLLRMTGFSSSSTVLMAYSNIAQRVCDEIAYSLNEIPGPYPGLGVLLKPVSKDRQFLVLKKVAQWAVSEMTW